MSDYNKIAARLLAAAAKFKSVSHESLGVEEGKDKIVDSVQNILFPELWKGDSSTINLIDAFEKYAEKAQKSGLEKQDVFNMLFLAHRSDAVRLSYELMYGDLPNPMDVFKS